MKPLAILKQLSEHETDVINHKFITEHEITVSADVYWNWFKQFNIVKVHHRDNGLSLYFDIQESCDKFMEVLLRHELTISKEYFDKIPDDMIESEYHQVFNMIETVPVDLVYIICLPTNKRLQLRDHARQQVAPWF